MTRRKTVLPLALIAVLALGIAPGQVVAQNDEPAFEPGAGGPCGDGELGDRDNRGPGFGRRGWDRGMVAPGGRGGPGTGGLRLAIRNLDLSESQGEQIRAIFEAERDRASASHQQMRLLGEELREQIETDPYNEEAVRTKAAALAALRVEMAVLRARQSGQVRDLLTPEQLDQLEQSKEKRRAFRDDRHRRFEERRGRRARP
jgi:Spy/CpxP family protein refolding chaperone